MKRRTWRAESSRVVVAGLDVAVAGFGAGGLDAQHHDVVAGGGHGDALLQRLEEARLVGDHVVGGKDAQHRVGILALDEEGGQSAGGGGVAGHRLLDDLPGGNALQLVGDLMGQVLVGDDPGIVQTGQRLEPLNGLLDHGALAVQGKNLLGVGAAGAGPEAGTAASGKNHRTKIDWLRHRRHILPDKRYVCTVTGEIDTFLQREIATVRRRDDRTRISQSRRGETAQLGTRDPMSLGLGQSARNSPMRRVPSSMFCLVTG